MVRNSGGVAVAAVVTALVVAGSLLMFHRPANSADDPLKHTEVAADAAEGPPFDGKKAISYLEEVCKIGPRISGTEGMKKQQELLLKHFEDLGAQAEFQKFRTTQVSRRQPTEFANLVVRWHPESKRRVLLCSHYDTRPIADQEPERVSWGKPFVSANDGGSGVALLMELGRHMKDLKLNVGVDFVFFDGEEYVFHTGRDGDKYFLGSEHFAADYKKSRPKHQYLAALLFDMVGAKGAQFEIENNSWTLAGALVESVWKAAADARSPLFVRELGAGAIDDDHLALNRVGIPAIDIIDYGYMHGPRAHWHRLSDTPDKCSGETLAELARVVCFWMQRLK